MQKVKLKPVMPSLREKKRYMVYEIISRNKIGSYEQVADAITYTSLQFLGELGAAHAGIRVMHDQWSQNLQRGIVKVSHLYVNHLRTALMLINNINKEEVIIRTVGVSGILKRAKRKYFSLQQYN